MNWHNKMICTNFIRKTETMLHRLPHFMLLLLAAACIWMAGCSTDESVTPPDPTPGPGIDPTPPGSEETAQRIVVRLADYGLEEDSFATSDDLAALELQGCLFEQGRMTAVYDATRAADSETFEFRLDRPSQGRFYVLSRTEGLPDATVLLDAGTTEAEWQSRCIGLHDGEPLLFYTGHASLATAPATAASSRNDAAEATTSIDLLRSTARLDLQLQVVGTISIERFTIVGAALATSMFADVDTEPAEYGEVIFTPASPLTESCTEIARLYAQHDAGARLRVEAVVNGTRCTLEAALPAIILRNRIYVATIRKEQADLALSMTVEPWEQGGNTDLRPDFGGRITVAPAASTLPTGVSLSEDLTQVTLPYGATELLLALDCNDELELQPVTGYPLTVESIAPTGQEVENRLRIRKPLYAPGMPADEVTLRFRRKGLEEIYDEDCIRLRLSANPTTLEGELVFDTQDYTYDFGRYIDNELGRFTLADGKSLSVEFDAGEDPWILLTPASADSRTYRIVGGWRPNDPTANGRVQSARLVITDAADPAAREEYVVARRNYGLPVTWLHGVWWCKYNARGNSRSFDDQILCTTDPATAAGKSLFDYLRDCTSEEFYDLWGWAYQGDSGQGMRVVDQEGKLVMEGFTTTSTSHINKLPADALSPDGYELPTMEEFNRVFDATDYVWMMWSGSHTLRTPWEGHSLVKREQRRRNGLTVGSVQANDLLYMKMWSPDFTDHEPLTWYGPGAQWNADGIQHAGHYNNILFGVHSPEGSGWYIAGNMSALYMQKNGAGTKDTRVLRFKKSPVEYIYGE